MRNDLTTKNSTVKEVMKEFDLSRSTLWKYKKSGMPFERKMNGQVRFNIEECREWIKKTFSR